MSAMEGAAARMRVDAELHQRLGLDHAYQAAVLTRVSDVNRQRERFEMAIRRPVPQVPGAMLDRLHQIAAATADLA